MFRYIPFRIGMMLPFSVIRKLPYSRYVGSVVRSRIRKNGEGIPLTTMASRITSLNRLTDMN